jgi:hypothetical protein
MKKYIVATNRRIMEAQDMMHARFLYGRYEHATIELWDLEKGTTRTLKNK